MSTDRAVSFSHNEDGSSITVHHQGAHLTSWRNSGGDELLYTSPNAVYKDAVAIRGGVPIIFPQFGNRGPLPSHGFARVRMWKLKDVGNGKASFTLNVSPAELRGQGKDETQSSPCVLELVYTILFSNDELQLQIEIMNNDTMSEVEFAFAFHTYFAVSDIHKTLLNGVSRSDYIQCGSEEEGLKPCEMMSKFTKEFDRLYPNQRCAVMLIDLVKNRTLHISGSYLPDVVVWNPWIEKTLRTKDLPPDGYTRFVCVEHGAIENKVKLSPQATWKGTQCIRLLKAGEASY